MPEEPEAKKEKRRIRNVEDIVEAKPGTKTLVWGSPGLYLIFDHPNSLHPRGLKRWMFRYKRRGDGLPTEISVGHLPKISLDKARAAAEAHRYHLSEGVDPQLVRKVSHGQRITFEEVARQYIDIHSRGKGDRWLRNAELLIRYSEKIARNSVWSITRNQVEEAIAPLMARTWRQGRAALTFWEQVFKFAKQKGWREWENPCQWELFSTIFPRPSFEVSHHPALAYFDMPAFMSELRKHQSRGVGAVLLEFVILTALRPNKEARLIQWDEINWEQKILTVPAWRMKEKKLHRVPLSDRAVALLLEQKESATGHYVFPGRSPNKPVAEGNMIKLLRNTMGISKETADVHGLARNPFRDWCSEKNNFDFAAIEICLAHVVGSETTRAYFRSDLLDKRREIMDAWGSYCDQK